MNRIRMALVGVITLWTTAFALPAGGAQALSSTEHSPTAAEQNQQSDARAKCWGGTIKISGGVMKYVECDKGRLLKVSGIVKDTQYKGRCVYGKVRFVPSGHTHVYKNCADNPREPDDEQGPKHFDTGWHKARNADVTLA